MMSKLVPQDMFDLATKLDECNHQLIVNTSNEKVPEIIKALEDILKPWQNYLNDTAKHEAWVAFDAIKFFRTYDRTRQQVINAVDALSTKITELARAWALELCAECIKDTFRHFNTPADIVLFSSAIDEAKNHCLKAAFGEENRPLSELFKRVEHTGSDLID